MVTFAKIAQTKGKELSLEVIHIPYIGYFIGTQYRRDDIVKPFTRESAEIWDTRLEATLALTTSNWIQAESCNIDGMD